MHPPDVRAEGAILAFGALYERHLEKVFRFVTFRVADRSTSRDLTQDVFLSVLKGLGGLRRSDRFDVWLMRIAHNRVLNHYRSRSRRLSESELDDELRCSGAHAATVAPDERANG